MPTNSRSNASPAKSKKRSKSEHSPLGRRLIGAAEEMLAHARGETTLPMKIYHAPSAVDVRAIRQRTGLSQTAFARRYALSLRALQEWEQGRRAPESAVRAYLTVIDREPAAVVRALGGRAADSVVRSKLRKAG